ncbi:glycosyltransferase family 4 protein [Zhihengliuella halotolerans]|uniref:Glycosyl transferase family 4 n=1 Tax=Zhihengliuella halotolerans TaxID=370736 RepID=A0A4Q8AA36_9MICC|nr:glycosyltransferase family 1 protein [Zhihengliuella halotolerans]RZU60824.1 glycosyl transferase family 4 [Zhihengliuella halotolerans]
MASESTAPTRKVVINGRFLGQPVTGVQRFAEEVTAALLAIADFPVEILVPQGVRPRSDGPLAGHDVVEIGRTQGHLWEQVDLPLYLKRHGTPLLIGLSSTAPAFYRNQFAPHHDVTYVRFPESFSWKFRLVYGILAPLFLKNARRVITVSEFSKSEIADHFGLPKEKIVVIPNAPSAFFFEHRTEPLADPGAEKPYFLAVSSPNVHKNFERLEQAFMDFIDGSGSEVELRIIGQQANTFAARESRSTANIRYLGRVSDSELAQAYAGALAFVFPSLYEGFGIPPLEAQAAGAPVIASNAASIPEVLGDSALYFDPLDVDGMSELMRSSAADESLRNKLRLDGADNASKYSWSASARKLSKAIQDVLPIVA